MRDEVAIAQIVKELGRHNLLPAIVFRSSRNQCDIDAERASRSRDLRLSIPEQHEFRKVIEEVIKTYDMDRELLLSHPHYPSLVTTGVGAHHAGQLLMWRLLLEELMSRGLLKALVATGTVAAGVDFPARTVVITAHSRRGSEGYRKLTAAEFQQMSGRAGRRGKDTVGFCVAAPSMFCDARALLTIAKSPPEPLVSAYFPSPSTVLNLLRYRTVDGLRYTVERSLASFVDRREADKARRSVLSLADDLPSSIAQSIFQNSTVEGPGFTEPPSSVVAGLSAEQKKTLKKIRRTFRHAADLRARQVTTLEHVLSGLDALGHVSGTHLSDKGIWASNLCTNLVLELAEIIDSGIWAEPSVEKIIAVVASICADRHRNYLNSKSARIFTKDEQALIGDILISIGQLDMPGGVPEENRQVNTAAANTVLTWLHAENWQQFRGLLLLSGVAEGDAARLITQTAEQINQLSRLTESHFNLAMRCEEAKRLLLRPPLTDNLALE